MTPSQPTAFHGLRVVDLSGNRVGAQVSHLFADFGADVVMVEPPGGAEVRRHAAFPFWARGKRSVVLDLHDDDDRARLLSLIDGADVLVETFRPGVLDRMGLGHSTLAARNPRLVHTTITGFGPSGPYAGVRGYEGVVAAKLGVFAEFASMRPGGEPRFTTVPWCSFAATQAAAQGTLAALLEREQSGRGQHVETSLARAFGSLDTWAWFEYIIESKWPDAFQRAPVFDDDGIPLSPFPYFLLVAQTRDGQWLQFAQVAPHLFVALMKALGLAGMFTDPEWAGIPVFTDQERRRGLWEKMLAAAGQRTLAEWQEVFDADPDVFAEIFRSGPEALEHPQLVHDGMVVTVDEPTFGSVRQPGPLVHLSATPAVVTGPAPELDAHGDLAWGPADTGTAPEPDRSSAPLAGITVVELAQLFAAPFGATLLAELGARVIKVEPVTGDPIRTIIPFPESGGAKVMQGKESICLDLSTPEGMSVLHQLIARADVLLMGYRAGVAERMGLDPASVRALNPNIVRLEAPGYGLGAPNGHRPAYAPSIGAAAGVGRTNLGGSVSTDPDISMDQRREQSQRLTGATTAASAQSDGFAALGVATSALVGLLARARGGGAQDLLSTMLNTNAHAMSAQSVVYAGAPVEQTPDPDLRGFGALYRLYPTADGWLFLAAPSEREWGALTDALADEVDLAGDTRFASAADRATHDSALAEVLTSVFARRSAEAWESVLMAADVAGVAASGRGTAATYQSDEFGRASGYLVDVEHPTFGEHPRMAPYSSFSRSATVAGPGVLAGQHTDAVLRELGYDADAIADLRGRTIVA